MAELSAEQQELDITDQELWGEHGSELRGEWVRKKDAAARLGITERMVDKRVAKNLVRKRVRPDGVVEFLVPYKAEDEHAEKALLLLERYNGALAAQVEPIVGELARSRDVIREQAEEIGRLKARVEELERGRAHQAKPWWKFWERPYQAPS